MTVGVDQAGQQGLAVAVDHLGVAGAAGQLGMAAGGDHLAVVDQQRLETLQLAVAVERVAVDVVDQQVGGLHGRRQRQQGEQGQT